MEKFPISHGRTEQKFQKNISFVKRMENGSHQVVLLIAHNLVPPIIWTSKIGQGWTIPKNHKCTPESKKVFNVSLSQYLWTKNFFWRNKMATSNVERILDVALKFNEDEFLGHSIPFPGTCKNQFYFDFRQITPWSSDPRTVKLVREENFEHNFWKIGPDRTRIKIVFRMTDLVVHGSLPGS